LPRCVSNLRDDSSRFHEVTHEHRREHFNLLQSSQTTFITIQPNHQLGGNVRENRKNFGGTHSPIRVLRIRRAHADAKGNNKTFGVHARQHTKGLALREWTTSQVPNQRTSART
jgi:hypothetical protein